jgi:hypothetical protein
MKKQKIKTLDNKNIFYTYRWSFENNLDYFCNIEQYRFIYYTSKINILMVICINKKKTGSSSVCFIDLELTTRGQTRGHVTSPYLRPDISTKK